MIQFTHVRLWVFVIQKYGFQLNIPLSHFHQLFTASACVQRCCAWRQCFIHSSLFWFYIEPYCGKQEDARGNQEYYTKHHRQLKVKNTYISFLISRHHSVLQLESVWRTQGGKMRRKLRETEKRESVRGVKDERADNLNDEGEVRDLRDKSDGWERVGSKLRNTQTRKNRKENDATKTKECEAAGAEGEQPTVKKPFEQYADGQI